ncbi:hypothetical protein LTR56_001962 [Elasticomyces elasticus]|nr:hypothetical protein LTR22_011548 [Elasticomyces elasticus]KAK3658106.1 hypothetical protein LTR56_001962 [Elasticomyces elasticus]KAK5749118.1 hypothetical protein LTS12_020813 [Elasticomyces elasticus]
MQAIMRDNNLALFESADDCLIITELGEEAGLAQLFAANPVLFQEIRNSLDVQATNQDNADDAADANTNAKLICLSLQAELNPTISATTAVRDHLNAGVLQELINVYSAKDAPSKLDGKYSAGYVLSLLGACAMTLGCIISAPFTEYLKDMTDIQDGAKMPFEARNQLFEALYGPRTYENGKAYNFMADEASTKYGSGPSDDAREGADEERDGVVRYLPQQGSEGRERALDVRKVQGAEVLLQGASEGALEDP